MVTHCAVDNCNTTLFNKIPGVALHTCPVTNEMRSRWFKLLKNKCSSIDWNKSRICSKHFENKYFDSQRNLKENAVPTIFNNSSKIAAVAVQRSKVDRLLNKLTQSELSNDIKQNLTRLKEPSNLDVFVNDDLKCKPDAPMEAKLWLIVKKQDNLNTRLQDLVVQSKKHVEVLQRNAEASKVIRKEQEQTIESLKYIVKCLQEKHTTLEEQIEILTAVESR